MPKYVEPHADEISAFVRVYLSLFEKIKNEETIAEIELRQMLRHEELIAEGYTLKDVSLSKIDRKDIPKRYKVGFEDGYRFDIKYTIPGEDDIIISLYFWTTFVRYQGKVRKSDEAIFLIKDSRFKKPVYYSFPIHRTKNFIKTCTQWLNALMNKMATWPVCECGRPLPLYQKKYRKPEDLHSYYHRKCIHCHPNPKSILGASFYINMDQKQARFIASMHKRNFKQRMKTIEAGGTPTPRPFLKAEQKKKEEGIHYVKAYNDGEAPE